MRTHERFRQYELLHDVDVARALITARQLVCARFEPVMAVLPEAHLDFTFEKDGRYVTIAGAYALSSMLELREAPPIVWPAGVTRYSSAETFEEIEEFVEPWLAELALATYANDERIRVFSESGSIRDDISRARAEGLYGAAPLVDVMRSVGPYVYGYRFATAMDVLVDDARGANGAALLCGRSASVALRTADPERDAFVRRWFGAHRFLDPQEGSYDVVFSDEGSRKGRRASVHTGGPHEGDRAIVLAHPVPAVSLVSLDIEDSVPDRTFGVRTEEAVHTLASSVSGPEPTGGSGGRVLLLVREDWTQIDDADVDAPRVLRSWLEREGFTVDITGSGAPIDAAAFDLVHVFGSRHVEGALPFLERCAALGVPIVATPFADDPRGEAAWGGQVSLFAYRNGQDAAALEFYVDAIARRKRIVVGAVDPAQGAGAKPALARLLQLAGSVLTSGVEEERFLRETYGFGGPVLHAPAYLAPIAPHGAEGLVGTGEFALLHAPIDPAVSPLFVLAAVAREGLPLVWTGPVAHHELLHYVRTYASDRTYYIPPKLLSEAELEGLYARARVFIDVSWSGTGLNRIARAASYGASIVGSTNGFARDVLGASCFLADPGSPASIAAAIRAAWDGAPERRGQVRSQAAARFGGIAALVSTVTAYSEAAARTPAVP